MRIARLTLSGAGVSPPIPVSYLQPTFNVALAVIPSASVSALSCEAQYTLDDQSTFRTVNWSQTGTTVTITDGTQSFGQNSSNPYSQNPHGLTTGDSVTIQATAASAVGGFTNFDGNYSVTVVNSTTYTITVAPSQTAQGSGQVVPQRWAVSSAVPAATAARLYANTTQPATAFRLNVATLTGGTVDFIVLQGLGT